MYKRFTWCALAAALSACVALPALADGSESITPPEERALKEEDMALSDALIEHIAYMEELEARYAGADARDVEDIHALEGERAAGIYCRALGLKAPCVPDETSATGYRALSESERRVLSEPWWSWLTAASMFDVGVLASTSSCSRIPSPIVDPLVIYMDDEDRNNNNQRSGWLGASVSDGNTTWRFCRTSGLDFKPLRGAGMDNDYAVLQLGRVCPPGSRSIRRYQDNEDRRNSNYSRGNVYPNVNVRGRNWLTYYCYFESAAVAANRYMDEFPDPLRVVYGVFASTRFPAWHTCNSGFVYQDDEDFLNVNRWRPRPRNEAVMSGGNNTYRWLAWIC